MQTETLLEKTYQLLDTSKLTYREIAIGAAVDINWLGKLKQRAIGDPGVGKVERLYKFLAFGISAQQPANEALPNHHQNVGSPGNG